jgi:integrase/recombinase XerD
MAEQPSTEELQFHRFLLTTGKSLETARSYSKNIRFFFRWCDAHETAPQYLYRGDLEEWLSGELAVVSRSTARNRLFAVRNYYAYLATRLDNQRDQADPTAGIRIKRPRSLPKTPVTISDQRRLAFSARSTRDEAIVMMLVDTGIRIGELTAMKIEDIRWDEGAVTINGKGSKQRDVWPNPDVMTLLRTVVGARLKGPVWLTRFGKPMTRDRARKNFARLAERARVSAHPHKLRATFANNWLKEGGDLGALRIAMGHADLSTTLGYAAATEKDRAIETARRLNLGGRILRD